MVQYFPGTPSWSTYAGNVHCGILQIGPEEVTEGLLLFLRTGLGNIKTLFRGFADPDPELLTPRARGIRFTGGITWVVFVAATGKEFVALTGVTAKGVPKFVVPNTECLVFRVVGLIVAERFKVGAIVVGVFPNTSWLVFARFAHLLPQ